MSDSGGGSGTAPSSIARATSSAASGVSGVSAIFLGGCGCDLNWLILLREGWLGFVEADGCHRHLLGGQVNLVGGLKDFFVCGVRKVEITYVGPYIYRQFVTPQGKHGTRTAATFHLGGLLADIIDYLEAKLRGQPNHSPGKSFSV